MDVAVGVSVGVLVGVLVGVIVRVLVGVPVALGVAENVGVGLPPAQGADQVRGYLCMNQFRTPSTSASAEVSNPCSS